MAAGFCALTTRSAGAPRAEAPWVPGAECYNGIKGTWELPRSAVAGGWAAASRLCLSRCAACGRCAYVSLSLFNADCSWFHDCDMTKLFVKRRGAAGFITIAAAPMASMESRRARTR